jgi:NosR/NirI family nitrous oxide reductase transcriptional regulator
VGDSMDNYQRPLVILLGFLLCTISAAGELTKADIEQRFQNHVAHTGAAVASGVSLHVGEKLHDIPVWPLFSEQSPDSSPAEYVFETIDLAPIPGFEGTPINTLVEMDASGKFLSVEALTQHEPVFVSGLGPGPLINFLKQYEGLNLRQEITIASGYGNLSSHASGGANRVVVDGVAKATASVRIINQSILGAALAVARSKLGLAQQSAAALPATFKNTPFEKLDLPTLIQRGYVQHVTITNAEVEKLFTGTDGAGLDEAVLKNPNAIFVEITVASLNAPIIGRNLLGDDNWAQLQTYLQDNRPAYWVATSGGYGLTDEGFTPGSSPQRLELSQQDLPIELRDTNRDYARTPSFPNLNAALILAVSPHAGLDPGHPMEFCLTVSRARGSIMPVITQKQLTLHYTPPPELFDYPPKPLPEWLQAWQGRLPDLIIIGVALLLLTAVLVWPRFISVHPRRLFIFRLGFLLFTLIFIGWHAQGQLSIVQITGAIKSVVAGAGLASFLYDPISLLLIAFTAITLVVWGRATFCGWLCPFGVLQELVGLVARFNKIPQRRLPPRLSKLLSRSRYVVLAALLLAAAWMPSWAVKMVEIEPFKTAITVNFQREWPYLVWAVGVLLIGAFVYKFFCRYVCPLGAALTVAGKLRRFNWLPRIPSCGNPCQRCRHACHYDAITPQGHIDYDDCFQCLDCVGIYHDNERCVPKLIYSTKGVSIKVRPSKS